MALLSIKLGEFKRLVENSQSLKVVSQQQASGGYAVLAIDTAQDRAYSVRHARKSDPRTWRLDRLASLLEEIGVSHYEVRLYPKHRSKQ